MQSRLIVRDGRDSSTSCGALFFFLMIRRPPRSTLFPLHDALPISDRITVLHQGRVIAEGAPAAIQQNPEVQTDRRRRALGEDRKSTRLNSSHGYISYAVFCLQKKNDLANNIIVELLGEAREHQ